MSTKQAIGLSRQNIRTMASEIRELLGIKECFFPIVEFLDLVLPRIDDKFDLVIVESDELLPGHYAITYPDRHEMYVRRDVYEKAIEGDGRSRFTLCHELFHYLFHTSENISFARSDKHFYKFQDPEWQANTFAAELMIPMDLVKGMCVEEIMESCKVSKTCAEIQIEKYGF